MRFGEVLIELGYINELKLDIALQEQEYNLKAVAFAEPIGSILIRNGVISDEQRQKALVKYFQYISDDQSASDSFRKTAKVAVKALETTNPGKLSHESKVVLINKIEEIDEHIVQLHNSEIQNKEALIATMKQRIELLESDLTNFA